MEQQTANSKIHAAMEIKCCVCVAMKAIAHESIWKIFICTHSFEQRAHTAINRQTNQCRIVKRNIIKRQPIEIGYSCPRFRSFFSLFPFLLFVFHRFCSCSSIRNPDLLVRIDWFQFHHGNRSRTLEQTANRRTQWPNYRYFVIKTKAGKYVRYNVAITSVFCAAVAWIRMPSVVCRRSPVNHVRVPLLRFTIITLVLTREIIIMQANNFILFLDAPAAGDDAEAIPAGAAKCLSSAANYYVHACASARSPFRELLPPVCLGPDGIILCSSKWKMFR